MDDDKRPLSTGAFKSFVTEYNAAQNANNENQRKSLHWSVRTFIAVSLYTALTAGLFVIAYLTFEDEKDSLYYSQRATVVLSDLEPVPVSLANVIIGYVVIPQWTNVGNTYASEMNYHNDFQFSHEDLPGGFSAYSSPMKTEGPASLGPKQTLNAGAFRTSDGDPIYFPQSCFYDEAIGRYHYSYIWGYAQYRDVLRPQNERVSRYCWRIYGTLNVNGRLQFNHYLCDEGNCQDEACTSVYSRIKPPRMPAPELCHPIAIPNGAAMVTPPSSPPSQAPPPPPAAPPAK